jgi:pimeloyl-ACP methyl ester carboxylesterase
MTVHTVTIDGVGPVDLTVTDRGTGRPILLLHGGAGPGSVLGFAQLAADRLPAHVLVPTHPGFLGTPRPDGLKTVRQLAEAYARLLDAMSLNEVIVVGNSMGGWIAAELALLAPGRVGALVLVDAGGIQIPGLPDVDFFSLSFEQVLRLSWHNPSAFPKPAGPPSDAEKAALAANRSALALYGGNPSTSDPTLRGRVGQIRVPTLVLWGESDRIVPPEYGRAYAEAIPGARFQLLPGTGHVPQLESPDVLLAALAPFVDSTGPHPSKGPG